MENRLIQGTQEWLEMRKSHIGASDAPVILGQSIWKTPFQLWEEKLGLREQQKMNPAMMRGHELEPIARCAYSKHTGVIVEPAVVVHSEKKWMMASLDGLSLDRSIVVEIKCPKGVDHKTAAQGKIPTKYYAQLQHQLAVIGLKRLHYFSYREDSFHLIEVERDEDFIKSLYKEELAFWNNMQDFEPPKLSDRDFTERDDKEFLELAMSWSLAKEELDIVKERESDRRSALVEACNGINSRSCGVKVQKVSRKGNVDYKRLQEDEGIEVDKYRKAAVNSWRLSNK